MSSRNTLTNMSSRNTLRAKKSACRVVKTRKTLIKYNRRDWGLTHHQQAWARSLSGSLSGWRGRTWYHRARELAHLAHEEEVEALKKIEEEEEEDVQAGLYAEADEEKEESGSPFEETPDGSEDDEEYYEEEDLSEEEKAAAWADKARQMHLAGMGNKIMAGWDPVKKTYIRNYEMEECLARLKAARREAFDHHSSDEESEESENDEDEDESEEGEDIELDPEVHTQSASDTMDVTQSASNTMDATQPLTAESPPSSSPSPPPAPAPVVDWRVKARIGVEKKKLSVTKGWSVLTWNQKSNVNERYLVLEDDGVNIEPLRERKASSDEITALILSRVAAYERARIATDLPTFTPINGPEGMFRTALEAAGLQIVQASVGAAPDSPVHEDEDTTQPFSLTEPYQPQPSHARKRKREHEVDTSNKKKKVEKNVSEDVLAAQTLEEMKQKRLRGVFRPARSVPGEADSISRVVFVHLGLGGQEVTISKRGFDHVMNELRFLANVDGAVGEVTLNDPDFDPSSGDFSGAEDGNDVMAGVTVSKRRLAYTVVQGETQVLAGLFEMLGKETLLHRAGWEWDGLRLQVADGFVWRLSAETQGALREIEEMLRDGVVDEAEGVKVLVGVVPT